MKFVWSETDSDIGYYYARLIYDNGLCVLVATLCDLKNDFLVKHNDKIIKKYKNAYYTHTVENVDEWEIREDIVLEEAKKIVERRMFEYLCTKQKSLLKEIEKLDKQISWMLDNVDSLAPENATN